MSYFEALEDDVPIRKDAMGYNAYYPPCKYCGAPVYALSYLRDKTYACKDCRTLAVEQQKQENNEAAYTLKEKKLRVAIRRISKVARIEDYSAAIAVIEKQLSHAGWFQSSEEIMVALELLKCGVKVHHQVRVFDYRVDFVLPELRVLLEIDGPIFHGKERQKQREVRDAVLNHKFPGWEIIHISTENICINVTRLLPAIRTVLRRRGQRT